MSQSQQFYDEELFYFEEDLKQKPRDFSFELSYHNPINNKKKDKLKEIYEKRISNEHIKESPFYQQSRFQKQIILLGEYENFDDKRIQLTRIKQKELYYCQLQKLKQDLIGINDDRLSMEQLQNSHKLIIGTQQTNHDKFYHILDQHLCKVASVGEDKFNQYLQRLKVSHFKCASPQRKQINIGRSNNPNGIILKNLSVSRKHLTFQFNKQYLKINHRINNFVYCLKNCWPSSIYNKIPKEIALLIISYAKCSTIYSITDQKSTYGTAVKVRQEYLIDCDQRKYFLNTDTVRINFIKYTYPSNISVQEHNRKIQQYLQLQVLSQNTQIHSPQNQQYIAFTQKKQKLNVLSLTIKIDNNNKTIYLVSHKSHYTCGNGKFDIRMKDNRFKLEELQFEIVFKHSKWMVIDKRENKINFGLWRRLPQLQEFGIENHMIFKLGLDTFLKFQFPSI